MNDLLGLLSAIPGKLEDANNFIMGKLPAMLGQKVYENMRPQDKANATASMGILGALTKPASMKYNGKDMPVYGGTPFDNPVISMAGGPAASFPEKMMKGLPASTSKLKTVLSKAKQELADVVEGFHPMSGNENYEKGLRNYISTLEKHLSPFEVRDTTSPEAIINATRNNGGYSVDMNTGSIPSDGYMVGQFPNEASRTKVLNSIDEMDPEAIMRFLRSNTDVLSQPDMHLGTWADDGKVYMDISKRYAPDQAKNAVIDAKRTGQKAIFNMGDFTEIPESKYGDYLKSLMPFLIGGGAAAGLAYPQNQ